MKKQRGKKPNLRIYLTSLAILYLLLVVFSYVNIGRVKIRIRNTGEASERATSNAVNINYIAVNGIQISNRSDALSGEYTTAEEETHALRLDAEKELILHVPLFSRVSIEFKRTPDSGYMELTDRTRTRKINLLGTEGEPVVCYPRTTTVVNWIMLFALLFTVYCLLVFTINRVSRRIPITRCDFLWILLTGVAGRLYYFKYLKPMYIFMPDTYTYEGFFKGKMYDIRTPIYPLLFQLAKCFTEGEKVYELVVWIQMGLGCLSVFLFWKVAKKLCNIKIAVILSMVFANLPMIIFYEHALMSESLSVFLLLWNIYLVQKYISSPSVTTGFWIAFAATLAIMERSGYIYLIPLLSVFYLLYLFYVSKETKKKVICSLVCMILPVIAVLSWCMLNYKTIGKFEISCVPVLYNDGYKITHNSFYEGTEYAEIENDITEYKMDYGNNSWDYAGKLEEKYGNEYTEFIKQATSVNRREIAIYSIGKIIEQFSQPIVVSPISDPTWKDFNQSQPAISPEGLICEKIINYAFCPFSYGFLGALIVINLIFFLWKWIKHGRVHWLGIGMTGIIFSTVFLAIWNGYADYQRLTISIIPVVYLSLAMWIGFQPKKAH